MLEISKSKNNIGSTFSSTNPNIYNQFKKDHDGEVFERVVFDLMLNKYSDDADLSDYILSLPNDKQRMALLSLIDGDTALWSKMNSYVNECSDKFEHIKDVIELMSKFVKDGEVERKKFGEVMTPLEMVKEMLNTLPKEVWSNPNLKWLDPCNGAGTFPYVVIYKLMNGLSEWEPDTEKRYKHIVENMIYTCELQSRNVFLWLCGVDPKNEYTTNSYWGSFLDGEFEYHMKNVWGVEKFDIVIGNPPYQEISQTGKSKGGGKGGDNNLWSQFIIKSIKICDRLLFINPPSFLSPNHNVLNSMLENGGLTYLHVFDKSPFEGVGTQACFYIWENGYNGVTKTTNGDISLSVGSILPNSSNVVDFLIFDKFFSKSDKFKFISNSKLHRTNKKEFISDKKSDEFKYKLYHGSSIIWSKIEVDNHKNGKVIISDSGYLNPQFDYHCSTTQHSFFLIEDDEKIGRNIIKILNSELYKYCLNKSKFSGFFHGNVLKGIPLIDTNKDWTDDMIFEYFNISEEEIYLIVENNKDIKNKKKT